MHNSFVVALVYYNEITTWTWADSLGNLGRLRDTNSVIGQLNNNRKIYFKIYFFIFLGLSRLQQYYYWSSADEICQLVRVCKACCCGNWRDGSEGALLWQGRDLIEGFIPAGKQLTNHALVYMVRELTEKWKQAVGYFLSSGPISAADMKVHLQLQVCPYSDTSVQRWLRQIWIYYGKRLKWIGLYKHTNVIKMSAIHCIICSTLWS